MELGYVPLHIHTHYSDGLTLPEEYLDFLNESKCKSVAFTDHGNLSCLLNAMIYNKKKEYNIKIIPGQEFYYVSDIDRISEVKNRHLLLIAKNKKGYKNLMKLSSISFNYFYYRPHIDFDLLEKYSEGLIATSACIAGILSNLILRDKIDSAIKLASKFKNLFDEDFYIEVQPVDIPKQKYVNEKLVEISKRLNIELMVATDSHYIDVSDKKLHETFVAIKRKNVKNIGTYYGLPEVDVVYSDLLDRGLSKKSAMRSIENTFAISDKCEGFDIGKNKLEFVISEEDAIKFIDKKLKRIMPDLSKEYRDRISFEYNTIKKSKFVGYFYVVQDLINFARKNGILVGAARGSVAGSLMAYFLKITTVDPVKHNLMFERFMNETRISVEAPDIDIDFDKEKVYEVFNYLVEKYGLNNVARVSSFNRFGARASLKGVADVFGLDFSIVNSYTKKIFNNETIEQAIERLPELKEFKLNNEKLFRYAKKIEGKISYTSKHAAGVLISPKNVSDIIPLMLVKEEKSEIKFISQYDKQHLEKCGIIKIDLLALMTLTEMRKALDFIKNNKGDEVDLDDANILTNKSIISNFSKGDTDTCFQFETYSMKKLLRACNVKSFDDIAMINAAGRPGTLSMSIEDFIKRASGEEEIKYIDDSLKPILSETYGIPIYQEQLMKITQVVGGLTLTEANIIRSCIKKFDYEGAKEYKDRFLKHAIDVLNIEKTKAAKIWSSIETAGYGFNKSHSTAYTIIAFQCMYLRTYYPLEWLCSVLDCNYSDKEKLIIYAAYCYKNGIKLLPPNNKYSEVDFSIKNKSIVFGLKSVSGIGDKLAKRLKELLPCADAKTLIEKAKKEKVTINKNILAKLIQLRFFDDYEKSNEFYVEKYGDLQLYSEDVACIKNIGIKFF